MRLKSQSGVAGCSGWLLVAFGCSIAGAQERTKQVDPGPTTLQVTAQSVVLDIVVTNKEGEIVRGLTKEDFLVLEDKTPQKIASFEEVEAKTAAAAVVNSTAELDKTEPNAPVSILVIDELTTKFEDLAFARYSLTKYLKAQGDVLEQPTMLTWA